MTHTIAREHLLSTVQMATFVADGALGFDGVVPDEVNAEAVEHLTAGIPSHPYGTPLDMAYPQGSFVRKLLDLPTVAGAITSLVGPNPSIDHHAVHVRNPHEGSAQHMHGDAIIDPRLDSFDVQLMYYPREVTLDMGGTLSVPGTHLRRINEGTIGRYQNLKGQTRLVCPAGTIMLLHHGIWHGGRRNDSDVERYMFKIRFNPTVRQLRLWNTDDIDDPAVLDILGKGHPWCGGAEARLEQVNRAKLWRALTGDPHFDIAYYLTRHEVRATRTAPHATDSRLGGVGRATGWNL